MSFYINNNIRNITREDQIRFIEIEIYLKLNSNDLTHLLS